jgi:hypothetical protein
MQTDLSSIKGTLDQHQTRFDSISSKLDLILGRLDTQSAQARQA